MSQNESLAFTAIFFLYVLVGTIDYQDQNRMYAASYVSTHAYPPQAGASGKQRTNAFIVDAQSALCQQPRYRTKTICDVQFLKGDRYAHNQE